MTLPLAAADRQTSWQPLWLVEFGDMNWLQADSFQLDSFQAGPTGLLFATRDFDGLSQGYAGRLMGPPTITRRTRETFFGTLELADVSLALANADGALTDYFVKDARGCTVTIKRHDAASGTSITEFIGSIQEVGLEIGVLRITAKSQDLTVLETPVPRRTVTTADFPKAGDVGKVIPPVLGNVPKVRLVYVNDDTTNNLYDYICEGPVTISALYRDGPNGTLFAVGASEYTVSQQLYPGYTCVRFTTRQTNFQNALHVIYADVTGYQTERNFARAIQRILTDTNWGLGSLGQAVDGTFDTAAADLDTVGGLYCDGALTEQRPAQDVLRELLTVRGMRLGLNASGRWTLVVDKAASQARLRAQDGTADGERNLVRIGPRARLRLADQVGRYILAYRRDLLAGQYLFRQGRDVNPGRGQERTLESPWIRDHTTADKTIDYLGKRELYGNETCPVTLTQEARQLAEGDVVEVTYAPLGYSAQDLEAIEVEKTLEEIRATLRGWDPAIYTYAAGTLPADNVAGTFTDYARVAPSPVTNLALDSTGTELGSDGSSTAYAILRFDTPTVNYGKSVIRHRLTGGTVWASGTQVTFDKGVGVKVKVPGLVPGKTYDFTVQVVNLFEVISQGDPVI